MNALPSESSLGVDTGWMSIGLDILLGLHGSASDWDRRRSTTNSP